MNIAKGDIYFDKNGWSQNNDYGSGDVIITGQTYEYCVYVHGGEHNITLRNCKIDTNSTLEALEITQSSTVNLNIEGVNILNCISVNINNTINISGTGSIELTSEKYVCDINGDGKVDKSDLTEI